MDETTARRLSRPVGPGSRRNRRGPPAEMIAAEENTQRCNVTHACLPSMALEREDVHDGAELLREML